MRNVWQRGLTAWICLWLVSNGLADSPDPEGIPFRLEHNLIFLEVRANGQGPLLFLLDTGAAITVVLPDIAKKLAMKELPGVVMVGGVGGVAQAKMSRLDTLEVGSAKQKNVDCAIADLTFIALQLKQLGLDVSGVLGHTFNAKYNLRIDYQKKRLYYEDPAAVGQKGPGSYLGVTVKPLDEAAKKQTGREQGVSVDSVASGSPASKAYIRSKDVIVAVDGKKVQNRDDLGKILRVLGPGQEVEVELYRGKSKKSVKAKLSEPPL